MKNAGGTTILRNGQVIDGTGADPLPNGIVVIQDGRLRFVGVERDLPDLPPDAVELDADGGTIMPGLVKAHFHPTC